MPSIDKLLQYAENLNKEDQILLLKRLQALVHKKEAGKDPTMLSSISGLGSSIWSDINIDDYLANERQW